MWANTFPQQKFQRVKSWKAENLHMQGGKFVKQKE